MHRDTKGGRGAEGLELGIRSKLCLFFTTNVIILHFVISKHFMYYFSVFMNYSLLYSYHFLFACLLIF